MQLTLVVVRHRGQVPAAPQRMVFGERGGSIGRAPGNDLQLQDDQRFVSSRHAEIVRVEAGFELADLSVNGVYINGATEPLGPDRRAPLRDGDQLRLGDYEISVHLGSEPPPSDGFEVPEAAPPATGRPPMERLFTPAPDVAARGVDPLSLFAPVSDAGMRNAEEDTAIAAAPHEEVFVPPPIPEDWDGAAQADAQRQDEPAPSPEAGAGQVGSSTAASARDVHDETWLATFATAAGIDRGALDGVASEDVATRAGALLRAAVAGTAVRLRSRAELKALLRADRTLAWRSDNPLRNLSATPESTLAALLRRAGEPEQPLAEVEADLRTHELALIAGVQAALRDVIARLDPAAAEAAARADGKRFGASPKARALTALEQEHAALAEALARGTLLSEAFADAYQAEARALRIDGAEDKPPVTSQRADQ